MGDVRRFRKVGNQEPGYLEDTKIIAACAGHFFQVIFNIFHQDGGIALGFAFPARLHIHVNFRSGQLIKPLIHDEERRIDPAGEIKIIEQGGSTKKRPGKIVGFPFLIHAMFLDGQSRQETGHGRHRERRRHRLRIPGDRTFPGEFLKNRHGPVLNHVIAYALQDKQQDVIGLGWG